MQTILYLEPKVSHLIYRYGYVNILAIFVCSFVFLHYIFYVFKDFHVPIPSFCFSSLQMLQEPINSNNIVFLV